MGEQGELVPMAQVIIDENLTLLLAKSEGVPRFGIFNTKMNKKKYTYLSWVEGAERSLKIKVGRNETKEYPMESIHEAVSVLIERAEKELTVKMLVWHGVQVLGDLLHMPKLVKNAADCELIAENKRDTLWFAYVPIDDDWRVRPCFVPTEAERPVLASHIVEGKPWPGLPMTYGAHFPPSMRNHAAAQELFRLTPERWSEVLIVLSKALLLGFNDWTPDGEYTFGKALWAHLPSRDFRSEETLKALASAGRPFIERMTAYLRLWPVIEKTDEQYVVEAPKTAEERGFKKRERFEVVAPHLGDKRFTVTRCEDDGGEVAFCIVPASRLPGEQDRFFTVELGDWEASVDACSLGGQHDPQFTCNSLIWGLETRHWLNSIRPCLSGRRPQAAAG